MCKLKSFYYVFLQSYYQALYDWSQIVYDSKQATDELYLLKT